MEFAAVIKECYIIYIIYMNFMLWAKLLLLFYIHSLLLLLLSLGSLISHCYTTATTTKATTLVQHFLDLCCFRWSAAVSGRVRVTATCLSGRPGVCVTDRADIHSQVCQHRYS